MSRVVLCTIAAFMTPWAIWAFIMQDMTIMFRSEFARVTWLYFTVIVAGLGYAASNHILGGKK